MKSETTTKFNIGDGIKYIGPIPSHYIGETGVIDEIRGVGRNFPYRVRFDKGFWYPVSVSEIELEKIVGQQLLFPFMKE